MEQQMPVTPKKGPLKKILPSSRYSTENNENNLTPENVENVQEVKLNSMVEAMKKHGIGNKPIPFHHPLLNKASPKMKLPAHLQGGRRTRKGKQSKKRTHKRRR